MAKLKTLLVLLLSLQFARPAKILGIFHMASYSHFILGEVLFKELASRGHEVTMISPFPPKAPLKNYAHVDLFEVKQMLDEMFKKKEFNMFQFQSMPNVVKLMFVNKFGYETAEKTLESSGVRSLLESDEKFDLIVMESFLNEAFFGFAYRYDAPMVVFATSGPSIWTNRLTGNPSPLSFVPEPITSYPPTMSFLERLNNLIAAVANEVVSHLYWLPKHDGLMRKHFPGAPHLYELMRNTSLVLINSHPGLSAPVPLLPNMKEVGGLHITEENQLPDDIRSFLDNNENVVYFALGSNLKSKDLPPEKLAAFVDAFARWNGPVLWKFEDDELPAKLDNVVTAKWLPQTAVLAHRNVAAFISHGGRLSTLESVYYGVPFIGIPIAAEQPFNVAQAVHAGYGYRLDFDDLTADSVYAALVEVTSNPAYAERARVVSRSFREEPMRPAERAAFWIEYVLKFKGAEHLRAYGVNLPWYRYLMVDVFLFLGFVAVVSFGFIGFLIKRVIARRSKRVTKKTKVN